MTDHKQDCLYHLVSSLAALDAALEELQSALTIIKMNKKSLRGTFIPEASIKLDLINHLLHKFETQHYDHDKKHKEKPFPPDPSRN